MDKLGLHLELEIHEANVVKYLSEFKGEQREEKAIEALKVGVIAIQSASPTLDTTIVDTKFREVEEKIETNLTEFTDELKSKLEENFKPGVGALPISFEKFFGAEGIVNSTFERYFSPDGKLSKIIEQQLGPNSSFSRALDPDSKQSVIAKIEESVQRQLEDKVKKLVDQFSLDIPDSSMTKLKKCVTEEIENIRKENKQFYADLQGALGLEVGKKTEAERGTQKGRDFEIALYDCVALMAQDLGNSSDNVRSVAGAIERCKTGDYICTLGEDSAAPNLNIVIEAKNEKGYKLKDALVELAEAKKNRRAEAGILVFDENCVPIEIGEFHRVGNDFFVSVNEDEVYNGGRLLFLESAYKICRTLAITSKRAKKSANLDLVRISSEVEHLISLVKRLSEIETKIKTIFSNSEKIKEITSEIKIEMEERLENIHELLEVEKED